MNKDKLDLQKKYPKTINLIQILQKRLTNLLQPADISWMRFLKCSLHTKWNNWMINEPHTYTPAGNMRSPGD